VDPNKQMADLTTDEFASVCAEFTRSLNASFGTVEIQCKFGSHAGNRQGTACQTWYDQCLQTPTPDTLMYCTAAMGGFQNNCPVTIGQYQACYNERYGALLTGIELAAACGPVLGQPCSSSACAGAAGGCDYTWFD
jgi:hypothetical protein